MLGEESATGIRFFVDPRVVDGTEWITGANLDQKHVLRPRRGPRLHADGVVEAADVRAGDPAPDGSGPVELARGMEIGHVFQLGRKYADALGLKVLDENGKLATVTMGSYGIGVTRILAIIAEGHHDDKGLVWPASVAPFDVHVLATGKDAAVFDAAETVAAALEAAGLDVLYDDRPEGLARREVRRRRAHRRAEDRDRRPRRRRRRRRGLGPRARATASPCRSTGSSPRSA